MMQVFLSISLVIILIWPLWVQAGESLSLMHAQTYERITNWHRYLVSEKYDGVRAVWDGSMLRSRQGNPLLVPDWFVEGLGAVSVEGELWLGYGRFSELVGLLNRADVTDPRWQEVSLMLFDAPGQRQSFTDRMDFLSSLATDIDHSWIKVVSHQTVSSEQELNIALKAVLQKGGEGLMLNEHDAFYEPARTSSALKYKPVYDAEAEVIGYEPGKGKYEGMVGSLKVRMSDGREFRLGSGLTDQDRKNPPALHSWVTFSYSGLTSHGLPRFARYVRPYEAL